MIDKVEGNRIGADYNPYLIKALKFIQETPYKIPNIITEDYYKELQHKKELN